MIARDANLDLFERNVPRYRSYPAPGRFHAGVGAERFDAWLAALPAGSRVALQLHIPFCDRLCWFCACRTQAAPGRAAIDAYLAALGAEVDRVVARLPAGAAVAAMHWGGGTPTMLAPAQVRRLTERVRRALPVPAFTVEADARSLAPAALAALVEAGLTGAELCLPDLDPEVQRAIGRRQDRAATAAAVALLRAAGVSVGLELLYGLPAQSLGSFTATCRAALALAPDRLTLTGYAHVPWIAKRQGMVDARRLPATAARLAQLRRAAELAGAAGYVAVGIDRFVRPGDPLARAAAEGRLRRGLMGYAEAGVAAVIGFGAGAISGFPQGYVQNADATGEYRARIAAGPGAGCRGFALDLADRVRGRAIEMLMCDFHLDLAALRAEFGDFALLLEPEIAAAAARFGGLVERSAQGLRILAEPPLLARQVARAFDARADPSGRDGQAV
jgi:oxygen-independent coproporphyrinogen-3 oxidase